MDPVMSSQDSLELTCMPTTTLSLESVKCANEGSDDLPSRIANCFPELGRHVMQWPTEVLQMRPLPSLWITPGKELRNGS